MKKLLLKTTTSVVLPKEHMTDVYHLINKHYTGDPHIPLTAIITSAHQEAGKHIHRNFFVEVNVEVMEDGTIKISMPEQTFKVGE